MRLKFFLVIYLLFQFGNVTGQINWTQLSLGAQDNITKLFFCDANTGFALTNIGGLAEYGNVFKTTNGGITWNNVIPQIFGRPVNIQFFDDNTGLIFSGRGVYKTTNRGTNWFVKNPSGSIYGYSGQAAYFLDTANYIIFSTGPKEYYMERTTNGGANWTRVYYSAGSTPSYPNFIFTDNNTGYMISGGSMKKTSNSGLNWTNAFGSGPYSSRFAYKLNPQIIFGIGYANNTRTFSKSSDGGILWNNQTDPFAAPYIGMDFTNQTTGFICGEGGTIRYTTNQGSLWIDYYIGTSSNLNTIVFINSSTGYIGGDNGLIFKTTNTGGLTNIVSNSSAPSDFSLGQNYPNPFNPSTIIDYQLAINSFVAIKVYDISGKEVAELVNEVKNAGYYSVSFDAKNLSSGMYFYKLSTDSFSDVKKMVVVK